MSFIKSLRNVTLGVVGAAVLVTGHAVFETTKKPLTREERVRAIYRAIAAQTGEINMIPPLNFSDSTEVNAYAESTGITINKGFLDYVQNDDEIAMVIGHEMAHVTLGHVSIKERPEWWDSSVMEAQADKMGALYMIKAGYDVCNGRELYKRWMHEGDYLFATHPNYAYRYSQLDVNCPGDI